MKSIHALTILPFILLAVCCSQQPVAVPENSIAFSPEKLEFEQQGGELKFYVTSSAAGIQVYSDDDWVSSIEPPRMQLSQSR